MESTYASLMLMAIMLAIVVAICWIILPFAVLGTKPLLRQLLTEQQRTNMLLADLVEQRTTARQPAIERDPAPAASRMPPQPRFTGSSSLPPT